MTTLTAPHAIPHSEHDPACYLCWFTDSACRDVCSACGCTWTMDSLGDPNRQDDACEGGCACHAGAPDPIDLWRDYRDLSELELRAIGGDR